MTEKDICQKCNKPKNQKSAGLVTQLVDLCICDIQLDSQTQTITVCASCGKRIPTRSGSITQWVFKDGNCSCTRPKPVETPRDKYKSAIFEGKSSEEEIELELDKEEFPVERYKPVKALGKGAAGVVYLCRDRLLSKRVAVKTLLRLSGDQLIQFQEEARATAKLSHPNIVKILDFGATDSGIPYMVMDYVEGISLDQFIREYGPLDEESTRVLFSRLSEALDYAHERAVYHRDLKPSNIILVEDQDENEGLDLLLIDFGIAKAKEQSGFTTSYKDKTLAGTPRYMSPDPARNEAYDNRSEIYSLGCVLFETLTGQAPFNGETPLEILAKHLQKPPPELTEFTDNCSQGMNEIVRRCLAKEKEKRFQSMSELSIALSDITIDTTEPEDQKTEPEPQFKSKSSPAPFIALGLCLLVGVAIAGSLLFRKPPSTYKPKKRKPPIADSLKEAMNPKVYDKEFMPVTNEDKADSKAPRLVKMGESLTVMGGITSKDDIDILNGKSFYSTLGFTDQNLRGDILQKLPEHQIENLGMRYCSLDKEALSFVAKVPRLTTFHIGFCELDTSSLVALSQCKNLKSLGIMGMTIDKPAIEAISKIDSLINLDICDCNMLSINPIEPLSRLNRLRYYNISGSRFKDESLNSLNTLKNLTSFNLSRAPETLLTGLNDSNITRLIISRNRDITDTELMFLTGLKKVKSLEIQDCGKVHETFPQVFALKNKSCRVKIINNTRMLIEVDSLY